MEVHHHPELPREQKRFRHYFLEFLMISLAVTMGFFAETIRENITEHARAREFAESLVNDLEADTIQPHRYLHYFTIAANNVDTLMSLLSAADPKDLPSGKLFWFGFFGGARLYFVSNDATINEMKNSGSLWYFYETVSVEVSKYDRICHFISTNDQYSQGVYGAVRQPRGALFSFRYSEAANQVFQHGNIPSRIDSFCMSSPPLLSTDRVQFNQYLELCRSRFFRVNLSLGDSALQQATKLLAVLKDN